VSISSCKKPSTLCLLA